ncbi:SCO7613 C-terminal domain-containing membrane protein [Longispora urticae]
MSTYPCPGCGTEADSVAGCPGCGRPADPLAVELTELTGRIRALAATIADLQGRLGGAVAERNAAVERHTRLLHQLKIRQLAEQRGAQAWAPGAYPVPGPGGQPGALPVPGQGLVPGLVPGSVPGSGSGSGSGSGKGPFTAPDSVPAADSASGGAGLGTAAGTGFGEVPVTGPGTAPAFGTGGYAGSGVGGPGQGPVAGQPGGFGPTGQRGLPAGPGQSAYPGRPGQPGHLGQPGWPGAPGAQPVAPGAVKAVSAQNVLLILGGVLLGIAAIVFVVVAWSTFGLAGRALLLAGVTALFLIAPVPLARRQLTATAETLASVGLLLIPLDGYAARIAGFTPWPPAGYAAGVFALTACAAGAYAAATRLRAPAIATLLAVQPIAPLLAGQLHAPAAGWSLAFTITAAINLAVAWPLFGSTGARRSGTGAGAGSGVGVGRGTGVGTGTWAGAGGESGADTGAGARVGAGAEAASGTGIGTHAGAGTGAGVGTRAGAGGFPVLVRWFAAGLGGLALTLGGLFALPPLLFGDTTSTLRGAGAGLAVAAVLAAAAVAGRGVARGVFAGLATAPVVVVAARLVWVGLPDHRLIGVVTVAALLLLAASRLPRPARTGALVATGVGAGAAGAATVASALYAGAAAIVGVWPVWRGAPGSYQARVLDLGTLDWQLPAALAVTTAAVLVVSRWRDTLLVGGALVALCAPAVLGAPYWTVPAVTGLAAGALGLRALRQPLWLLGAVPLGLHAVAVCLGTPTATAAGLAGVVVTTAVVAALGFRTPLVGPLACGVALSTLPGFAAVTAHAAGGSDRWAGLAGLAAATLALGGAFALRGTSYVRAAAIAIAVGSTAVTFATVFTDEPTTLYAAYAAVLSVAASLLPPVRNPWLLLRPAVPLLWAAGGTLPALVLTLFGPWAQLREVWQGPVSPGNGVGPRDLYVLGAVAVATTLAGYGLLGRRALTALGLPLGALVVLTAPVALETPWPVAAVVALALGLGCALYAALRVDRFDGVAAVLVVVAALATGAGAASLLATRAGTLAALGALLVAGAVAVLGGRSVAGRAAGWVIGSVAFLALLPVACAAADAGRLWQGYALLGAAVVLFGVAALAARLSSATGVVTPVADLAGAGAGGPFGEHGAVAGGQPSRPGASAGSPIGVAGGPGSVGAVRSGPVVPELAVLPEAFGWAGAVIAVAGMPTLRSAAIGCAVWGAALGMAALRRDRGRAYALAAVISETLAWWLLLGAARVGTPEAYTLPPALAVLGLGVWTARKRPELRSWIGYGPGLLGALLPSLAWSLPPDASVVRRVALGAAAVVVVVFGARARLRAPLVIGAGTLLVLALHELTLIWGWAPKWIPLALGGVLLIAFGATYEKRRRDLRRLRETYTSFR